MVGKVEKMATILLTLFLCGCANPYAKYYKDTTNGIDLASNSNYELPTSRPKLIKKTDHDETATRLKIEGYQMVGYSSFWGVESDEEKAIDHAEQIKASLVLLTRKYRNSESGSMPLVLPNTRTSSSNFSGNVGGTNYYGTGTTTTYGTQTTYIPYTNHYYNYLVSYWIKQKTFRLGTEPRELTDAEKTELNSNKGIAVNLVTKHTSAYEADILKNDLIVKLADDLVDDIPSFYKLLDKYEGSTIKITLVRKGQITTKEVRINKTIK